jgi:hypothetical protein
MFVLWLSSALATCLPADLGPALDRAERAYVDRNERVLRAAVAEASAAAACGDADSRSVARVHRARGLLDGLEGDWDAARIDFRSANAAYPLLPLSDALSADPALEWAWMRAQESPLTWSTGPVAHVNGVQTGLRPNAPVLVAHRPGRGMRWAALAAGVTSVATYGAAWGVRSGYQGFVVDPEEHARMVRKRHAVNALSVGSFTTGVFAGALLGASFTL